MAENKNNLNEEQLTEVTGWKELKPQIHDEATGLPDKRLESSYFLRKMRKDILKSKTYIGIFWLLM